MNTGMMWYDADPKTTLSTKVERAAEYYERKYGRRPNTCLVNPRMLEKVPGPPAAKAASPQTEESGLGGEKKVEVRGDGAVLAGHLWIGVEEPLAPLPAEADIPPNRKSADLGGTMMLKVGKKKAGRVLDGRTWEEIPNEG